VKSGLWRSRLISPLTPHYSPPNHSPKISVPFHSSTEWSGLEEYGNSNGSREFNGDSAHGHKSSRLRRIRTNGLIGRLVQDGASARTIEDSTAEIRIPLKQAQFARFAGQEQT
jgi:hypothetical protein